MLQAAGHFALRATTSRGNPVLRNVTVRTPTWEKCNKVEVPQGQPFAQVRQGFSLYPYFYMGARKTSISRTNGTNSLIFILKVIASQYQVQYPARGVPSHSNSKGFSTVNAPQWITKMINSGVQLKQIKMITILMVSGETVDCVI